MGVDHAPLFLFKLHGGIPIRKLALPEEILLQVEKPARYIGNEVNAYAKDMSQMDVNVVMCFPDVYEIGMSHLGIQILYDMLNQRDDVYCDRVYSPWTDLDLIMRERKIPLFGVESQAPIKDFDFVPCSVAITSFVYGLIILYGKIFDGFDIAYANLVKDLREPVIIVDGEYTFMEEQVIMLVSIREVIVFWQEI